MIRLNGITWDHARGYNPMVATADAYMKLRPDVVIEWKKRSLKEFGDFPIQKLAETFDLLVIDHPFVGFAAADGCLLPLESLVDSAFLADQAANSVGKSHESYFYAGHQWALAIDAAAQISAYRPDLITRAGVQVPRTWDDVLSLARQLQGGGKGWVAIPACPIDAGCSLSSIAVALGEAPGTRPDVFVSRAVGRQAAEMLRELVSLSHPESLRWNPIMLYNAMSSTDAVVYCPLAFGYSNYGRPGYAAHLISVTNVPVHGPVLKGAMLGGTGYAISRHCKHIDEAVRYGMYVAGGETQRTLYFESGGQPGHRHAWIDEKVNSASNDFFKNTLESLDSAYLRPRYNGFMKFQEASWETIHAFLVHKGHVDTLLDTLDALYRQSLQTGKA